MSDEARPRPHSPPADHVLMDEALELRPYALSDTATIAALDADPDVQRWFDWPQNSNGSPEAVAARLRSADATVRTKWDQWRSGKEYTFVIRDRQTDSGLGWVDVQLRGAGRGNVSYGVLAAWRGNGAATRAVRLISGFAFELLGLVRLEIRADATNVASRRVAEKAGFVLEGVFRSSGEIERYEPLQGRRFDEAMFALLE